MIDLIQLCYAGDPHTFTFYAFLHNNSLLHAFPTWCLQWVTAATHWDEQDRRNTLQEKLLSRALVCSSSLPYYLPTLACLPACYLSLLFNAILLCLPLHLSSSKHSPLPHHPFSTLFLPLPSGLFILLAGDDMTWIIPMPFRPDYRTRRAGFADPGGPGGRILVEDKWVEGQEGV